MKKIKICLFLFLAILNLCAYGQSTLLSVDAGNSFENRPNNYRGTTFFRNINIATHEQAQQNFTGYVKIVAKDELGMLVNLRVANNSKVTIVSPVVGNWGTSIPGFKDINLLPNTDNTIILKITDFVPINDVLAIVEKVDVTECLVNAPISNNKSWFSTYLYPTTSQTPPDDNLYTAIQGGAFNNIELYQGGTPEYELFDIDNHLNVVSLGQSYIYQYANLDPTDFYCTGNNNFTHLRQSLRRDATEPRFQDATLRDVIIKVANDGVNFTIDRLSIVITKFTALGVPITTWDADDQVPHDYYSIHYPNSHITRFYDPTSESCLSANQKFSYLQVHVGDLAPGEFYTIEYDLYNCCKKADLFDNAYLQSSTFFTIEFKDDCGNLASSPIGPNSPYPARGIYSSAEINSSPATLDGPSINSPFPEVGAFIIDNPLTQTTYHYGSVYGGVPTAYNVQTAELVIRLRGGPSLRYSAFQDNNGTITTLAGTYPHQTNPLNLSYFSSLRFIDKFNDAKQWIPFFVGPSNIDVNGFETTEFRFRLNEMPGINPNNATSIFNGFFDNMASLQLSFSMEGYLCKPGRWILERRVFI